MEEAAVRLGKIVKEEPFDVCADLGVGFNSWGYPNPSEELATTLNVDEEDVKTEENPNEIEESAEQKRYCPSLLPLKRQQLIGSEKKHELTYAKYVKIAKDYADLYKNERIPASTLRHFIFPSIIIECPDCMLPVSGQSRSSFLKLLQHVLRKHSNFELLFTNIVERYAPFVQFMKNKIMFRRRRLYLKKLRRLQHRKN